MRFSVTLSYDGAAFCGWQVQPGDPSVQACLEDALSKLLRTRVAVTGAGRTDSGVHAVGYVAHFDIEDVRGLPDPAEIAYKLNAILPPSVVVHSVVPAAPDFHARFDASKRKYTYFLHRMKDPFVENYSLRRDWDLDFEAMNRAAALLLGRHDFACFEKTGTDVRTSICTVSEAYWAPYVPTHVALMGFAPAASAPARPAGWLAGTGANSAAEDKLSALQMTQDARMDGVPRQPASLPGAGSSAPARGTGELQRAGMNPGGEGSLQLPGTPDLPCPDDWRYMYFRISADRFLRNMVRAVVGTLLEVGRGKRTVEEFGALILPAEADSTVERTKSADLVRLEPILAADRTDSGDSVRLERRKGSLRGLAGDSVPGHALFFSGAEYDPWQPTD